jgi:hypothetical protein
MFEVHRTAKKSGDMRIMRIGILIISSSLLFSILAVSAWAVNWNNPESQSLDQMFTGDSGSGAGWPAGESHGPQASRAAQAGQGNKEIISSPIGGHLASDASNPQQARSQELNQAAGTQSNIANSTEPIQSSTSSEPSALSGSWSLVLNDSTSRIAALTLFQNGDTIYGTGNINPDANTTLTAAASGTVVGDKADLDIVSVGMVSLYRISMTLSEESATGTYTAFSPNAVSTTGNVNGVRSAPSS